MFTLGDKVYLADAHEEDAIKLLIVSITHTLHSKKPVYGCKYGGTVIDYYEEELSYDKPLSDNLKGM